MGGPREWSLDDDPLLSEADYDVLVSALRQSINLDQWDGYHSLFICKRLAASISIVLSIVAAALLSGENNILPPFITAPIFTAVAVFIVSASIRADAAARTRSTADNLALVQRTLPAVVATAERRVNVTSCIVPGVGFDEVPQQAWVTVQLMAAPAEARETLPTPDTARWLRGAVLGGGEAIAVPGGGGGGGEAAASAHTPLLGGS